jgi:diaminohydroxyphosphoribosylaminopyrimidine deaminase / 5-amino-6-(5-phosphoribosylamino)uracil reductase
MALKAFNDDSIYMRRCLELALRGSGFTRPNPMVGAVIVYKDRIIGEGFHQKAGGPHAEVNAINSVSEKSLLKHSTIYVSLEPCSHFGKTPPCADLIIETGIKRVVAGTMDTTFRVAGKGFEKLREAGVNVTTGIMEDECRHLNRRFFTFHEKKRPYIILKWAQSADGFLDYLRKPGDAIETHWITGMTERVLVHRWRAEEGAILAGGATIRADNPGLNVRYWSGNNPVKVIVSKSADISPDARIFKSLPEVLLFTASESAKLPARTYVTDGDELPVKEILRTLYDSGIQSVIIEGGAKIFESFIISDFWDEARIFTGRKPFMAGIKAPVVEGRLTGTHIFTKSDLKIIINEHAQTLTVC